MFLELNALAGNICVVFFGVYCLLIGYLIFRSAFLPRILGVLMALAGSVAPCDGRERSTIEGTGQRSMKATVYRRSGTAGPLSGNPT